MHAVSGNLMLAVRCLVWITFDVHVLAEFKYTHWVSKDGFSGLICGSMPSVAQSKFYSVM